MTEAEDRYSTNGVGVMFGNIGDGVMKIVMKVPVLDMVKMGIWRNINASKYVDRGKM